MSSCPCCPFACVSCSGGLRAPCHGGGPQWPGPAHFSKRPSCVLGNSAGRGLATVMPPVGWALPGSGSPAGWGRPKCGQHGGLRRRPGAGAGLRDHLPFAQHLPFTGGPARDGSSCTVTVSRETDLWGSGRLDGNEIGSPWPSAPALLPYHGRGAPRGSPTSPGSPEPAAGSVLGSVRTWALGCVAGSLVLDSSGLRHDQGLWTAGILSGFDATCQGLSQCRLKKGRPHFRLMGSRSLEKALWGQGRDRPSPTLLLPRLALGDTFLGGLG